jgi:hypothetical protein
LCAIEIGGAADWQGSGDQTIRASNSSLKRAADKRCQTNRFVSGIGAPIPMRFLAFLSSPDLDDGANRRRSLAIALTLCIEALLLLALLLSGPTFGPKGKPGDPMISIQAQGEAQSERKESVEKQEERQEEEERKPEKAPETQTPPPKTAPPPVTTGGFIQMSREDFAAADIGKLPKRSKADSGSASAGGGASAGAGEGPGGVPLYNAEWYREPTDGEMALYLPAVRPPDSWAMIACQTVENYRVENCQAIGESSPGTGLARALRQASWQFRVRPPRVGNKAMVGAWVRIRFDFTRAKFD